MPTRQWSDMDVVIRRRVVNLAPEMVPSDPGVYAWYREGKRKYVGQAASLRARPWGNHLGQSPSLTSSALRRNVAHLLGFGSTAALKRRRLRELAADAAEYDVNVLEVAASNATTDEIYGREACGKPSLARALSG